jgi:DNA-binding transcriptional LysR family regulator
MRIHYRQVEIFWAVMTSGSVTKAAALLNTSQPTVSRELARFEHVLGLKLFDRLQGRLHPTAQGLALFDEVKNSYVGLERIGHLAKSLKNFKGGQVSIACLPAFSQSLLPPACAAFVQRHPEVNITITSQESPLLEEWLTAQRFDLGLVENAPSPAGTATELLFTGDVVCVLPRKHPLADRPLITPQDLQDQDLVSLSATDPYRMQLDGVLEREGVRTRSVIETPGAAAVCFFIQQGLGIGMLNPLTALSLSSLDIAVRPFSVSIPFSIYLVRPQYRPPSAVATAFADQLTSTAAGLSGELKALLQQRVLP